MGDGERKRERTRVWAEGGEGEDDERMRELYEILVVRVNQGERKDCCFWIRGEKIA